MKIRFRFGFLACLVSSVHHHGSSCINSIHHFLVILFMLWASFWMGGDALSYVRRMSQKTMGKSTVRFDPIYQNYHFETKLNVVANSDLSLKRKAKIPICLSFFADSKSKLAFPNLTTAAKYLSLPASEYRLLNMSFVERKANCSDTFTLIFPLRNLLVSMENAVDSTRSNSFLFLKYYELRGSVTVKVDAHLGRIEMKSGEFFFQKIANAESNTIGFTDANTSSIASCLSNSNMSNNILEIPQWLLWNSHSSPTSTEGKFFMQPFFKADIVWNPNLKEARTSHYLQPKTLYSHFTNIFNRKKAFHNEISSKYASDENVPLVAEVKVSCGASVHVQPGNNLFRALQSTPVKIAIEKMISLTLKTILFERQSQFNSALIQDCKERFG